VPVDGSGLYPSPPDSSTWRQFSLGAPSTTSSPDPITPADNAQTIPMPSLTWDAVTSATSYTVQYSVSGLASWTTLASGLPYNAYTSPSSPLVSGYYDWRVLAYNGATILATGAQRTFHLVDVLPVTSGWEMRDEGGSLESCHVGTECTSTPVFHWPGVSGAGYYLVYFAYDQNFTTINRVFTVRNTTFIPREEFPDNNAGQAYYWHVRACKAGSPARCSLDPQG
jgi:hypothetical protein